MIYLFKKFLFVSLATLSLSASALIPDAVLEKEYQKGDFYKIIAPYWNKNFDSYALKTYKIKSLKNIFIAEVPKDSGDEKHRGNHMIVRTTDNYVTRYPDDFEILKVEVNTQKDLFHSICEYQNECSLAASELLKYRPLKYKDVFAPYLLNKFNDLFKDKFVGKDFSQSKGKKLYNQFLVELNNKSDLVYSYQTAFEQIKQTALKYFSPYYEHSAADFITYLKLDLENLSGQEKQDRMNELFSYYTYGQKIKEIISDLDLYYITRLVPIACKQEQGAFCEKQRNYQQYIEKIKSELIEFDKETYNSYPFSSNFYSYAMKKKAKKD